ncbi:MAG: hypothetical protein ACIALR_14595 [Blastopirellula sp. JB062]
MKSASQPFDVSWSARLFWPSLLVIALVGFVLRCLPAFESLWLDELHSAWTIAGSWSDVSARALQGNNGPLYFWGLKAFSIMFGQSEAALRMPSILCGCATLIGVGALVRAWGGSALAGCAVALLIAFDRDMIFYATEVRPYAAVQLSCLTLFMMTTGLWSAFSARDAAYWTILAAFTIHLHITAALFVAACLPPVCLAAWGHRAAKRLFLMLAALALLLLPLIPQLCLIYARRSNWEAFVQSGSFFRIVEILPMIPWGILPLAIALGLNRYLTTEESGGRQRSTSTLVWSIVATAAPIAIAWTLTELRATPLFLRRYLMGSQTLLFVWCGLNIAQVRRRDARAVLAIITAVSVFFFHVPDHWTLQRRQDWRGAIAEANALRLPQQTAVLIGSRLIEADGLTQNFGALAEYSRLPIDSVYRVSDRFQTVIPLRYSNPGLLQPWQQQQLASEAAALVILPGYDATGAQMVEELSQTLPWPAKIRVLTTAQGMQMLLIEKEPTLKK